MELKEIQELVKLVSKNNIGELKIRDGEFQISIRANGYIVEPIPKPQSAIAAPTAPNPVAPVAESAGPKESAPAPEENGHVIKSPMVGTFYRRPGPDKDPFVKPGDTINHGDVICIIEAMKLFNEIEAEISGTVVKVLVEDSTPVEFDQPLIIVDAQG